MKLGKPVLTLLWHNAGKTVELACPQATHRHSECRRQGPLSAVPLKAAAVQPHRKMAMAAGGSHSTITHWWTTHCCRRALKSVVKPVLSLPKWPRTLPGVSRDMDSTFVRLILLMFNGFHAELCQHRKLYSRTVH